MGNQALVMEVVPSKSFLDLCRTIRRILNQVHNSEEEKDDDYVDHCFPPPLQIAHMSLYYGNEEPPLGHKYLDEIFRTNNNNNSQINDDGYYPFAAHRVMLWKTNPGSLEGVPEWKPLANFSLL